MVLSMDSETDTLVAVSRMLREIEARVVAEHQAQQGDENEQFETESR